MAKKKMKDELMDHDFDGIQELDNFLPPWWLYLFYFTIIWGIGYFLYYHVLEMGPLQEEEYALEMKQAEMQYGAPAAPTTPGAGEAALTPLTDEASIASGKAIFLERCMPCHGQFGEGGIGPNLTDKYWLHGGKYSDIVNTITNGVPAKGMIAWGPVLKPEEIQQVASYILTLQGTNPPNAKAPQGELVEN